MPARILIVEDEPAIRDLISVNLRHAGYEPIEAADADQARRHIDAALPDLILLDWMLPDISGVELARRLRADERTRGLAILMLTARAEEADTLQGFEAGVDDYLSKPFSPRELLARIKALLRRSAPDATDEPVEIAGLRLEPVTQRVSGNGEAIRLGPTEFRLLDALMQRPGRVYAREQLLDRVWGQDVYVEIRTVDVHIGRLRKALNRRGERDPIRTVRSSGYALDETYTG